MEFDSFCGLLSVCPSRRECPVITLADRGACFLHRKIEISFEENLYSARSPKTAAKWVEECDSFAESIHILQNRNNGLMTDKMIHEAILTEKEPKVGLIRLQM